VYPLDGAKSPGKHRIVCVCVSWYIGGMTGGVHTNTHAHTYGWIALTETVIPRRPPFCVHMPQLFTTRDFRGNLVKRPFALLIIIITWTSNVVINWRTGSEWARDKKGSSPPLYIYIMYAIYYTLYMVQLYIYIYMFIHSQYPYNISVSQRIPWRKEERTLHAMRVFSIDLVRPPLMTCWPTTPPPDVCVGVCVCIYIFISHHINSDG